MLNLLQQRLHAGNAGERDGWIVTWFTPWLYSDAETLQRGFFAELRQAMPADTRWRETRTQLAKVANALTPLAALAQVGGVNGEKPAEMLRDWIAGDTSVSATHRQAADALDRLDQPILVILDDLDRLEAPELLLTIKLVRMIGRLPNVHYLLSYDEQTLVDLLKHTSLVGDNDQRALDYLEKLVQVRVDLPALRPYQRTTLLTTALNAVRDERYAPLTNEQAQRLRTHLHEHGLLQRLDSPRTINRVMGQIDAFHGLLDGEVDFVDYLVITWLRTEEPRVYRMLEQYRDQLLGQSHEQLTRRLAASTRDWTIVQQRWRQRITDAVADPANSDSILQLLTSLFPVLQAELTGNLPNPQSTNSIAQRRGVGHPYYFDHYFSFGVPEEGLADTVVRDALTALSGHQEVDVIEGNDNTDGPDDPAVATVRAELHGDVERVTWKLEHYLTPGHPATTGLLDLVAHEFGRLNDGEVGLLLSRRNVVEGFIYRLLARTDPSDVLAFTDRQLATDDGLRLMGIVARIARPNNDPIDSTGALHTAPPWSEEVTRRTAAAYAVRHETDRTHTLDVFDRVGVGRWYSWWSLDSSAAATWLREQVQTGRWDLWSVLATWIGTRRIVGADDAPARVAELDDHLVEQVFGIDWVLEKLHSRITATTAPAVHWGEDLPDTPTNRDRVVLTTLQHWAHQREAATPSTSAADDDASAP